MTDATITPSEPTAETTPPAAPAAPAAPESTTSTPAATEIPDWAKDPATAARMVADLRAENARDRTSAKEKAAQEAQAELLTKLGLKPADEPADPAKVASDLAAARTAAADSARELAIYRAAPAGTDVNALLDSRSFLTTVASIDPTDTTALAAAIGQAITNTPRLKTGQAPAASGTDLPGGQQTVRTYTRAQLRDTAFYQANKSDIEAALREGRIH